MTDAIDKRTDAAPRNRIGFAGFILSIVGIITLGSYPRDATVTLKGLAGPAEPRGNYRLRILVPCLTR